MHYYSMLLLIVGCQLALSGAFAFFANRWCQKQPNKIEAQKRLSKIALIGISILFVAISSLSIHSYLTGGKMHFSTSSLLLVNLITILAVQQSKLKARSTRNH